MENSDEVFTNTFPFFRSYHNLLIGLRHYKKGRRSQIQLKTRIFSVVSSVTMTVGKKRKENAMTAEKHLQSPSVLKLYERNSSLQKIQLL